MADTNIRVLITGNSTSAEQAIDRVGKKAEQVLGGKMQGIVSKAFGVASMAGAAVGIGMIGTAIADVAAKATGLSDRLALTKSRINLINDGTQTTAELMDKIYSSAERARGSYLDMADSVGKLNMLAKDAFSSNDEAIVFVEQMNKQFKIGGASIQEQSAAMYQLTQAMAAGRLQGDEFRSIMENAPMLAQAIAQEMGVSVGKLREMSSEGLITADVIKSALFNSVEQTNAKFEELPMTFEEVGNQLANSAIVAFQPVMDMMKDTTGTEEFKAVLAGVETGLKGLGVAAQIGVSAIGGAITAGSNIVSRLGAAIKATGSIIVALGPPAIATFAGVTSYIVATRIATVALGGAMTTQQAITKGLAAVTGAYRAVLLGITTVTATFRTGLAILRTEMAIVRSITAATAVGTGILRAGYIAGRAGAVLFAGGQAVLNAVLRANPIGLVVTGVTILVSAFGAAEIASNGLSQTLSNVWDSILHTSAWAINKIIDLLNTLIRAFNKVGSTIASKLGKSFESVKEFERIDPESVQEFSNTTKKIAGKVFDIGNINADMGELNIGGGGGDIPDAGKAKGGKGGGGKSRENQALEEAKRTHEAILDSWYDMFGKQSELVDRWLAKELEELEKSKENNINYEEDRTRIIEMYAKKREQALYEEAKRVREIQNSIRDMSFDFNLSIQTKDSTGTESPLTKLANEYDKTITEIKDKWQGYSDDYAAMSKRDQEIYIASLKAQGVAFELTKNNELKFTEQINAQKLAADENYYKQRTELMRTQAEEEWAIAEAMRMQNFEALQQALTDEYVATKAAYDLKKEMLEEYQTSVMESHWSAQEAMFNATNAGLDSMAEGLSNILQGTKGVMTMFENMGKAVVKTLADMAAKWIAEQLKQMIFGKMLQSQQTAASVAAAQSQIGPWTQLAQQVSMATFGASATAGMAAWSAATAAGQTQSAAFGAIGGNMLGGNSGMTSGLHTFKPNLGDNLTGLADGGLAYGETYARIAEGKYPEAVLPLNEKVYGEIGEGIARSDRGGGNIILNVSAMDADSFSSWLGAKGGQVIKQYLYDGNREFTAETGVW
jgi:tape measure domain-containing protein